MSRNLLVEQKFRKKGIKFEYLKDLKLSDISETTQSSIYNVRLDTVLDEINLAAMEASFDDGVNLPAVVLYKNGKGVLEVVDGNHRLSVFRKKKQSTCDAYIISGKDHAETIKKVLQRTVNNWNGRDTKKNAAILAALAVKDSQGAIKPVEAAKDAGVTTGAVETHLRAMEVRRVLVDYGHDFRKKPLADTTLGALNQITNRRLAIAPAAAIAADSKMSISEVRTMARELRDAGDDKEVAETIAKYRKLYPHGRKSQSTSAGIASKLLRALSTVQNQISARGYLNNLKNGLSDIEKQALHKKIEDVKLALNEVVARM